MAQHTDEVGATSAGGAGRRGNRRRGRRPGGEGSRDAILAAARDAFGELGFEGATVRDIAGRAGVDPAMLNHYFGSKERLFQEVVDIPFDPQELLAEGAPEGVDGLGAHMVATLLRAWDSPQGRAGLALMRSATSSELAARMLREYMLARVLRPVVARVEPDPDAAAWRAALVASQLAGLIVARYVLRFEPVAGADPGRLVAAIGPQVQHYLTGELPDPGNPS